MAENTVASEAWDLAFGTMPVSAGVRMLTGAEVQHFPATDPTRFQKLCGIGDIDAFLRNDGARTPRVGVADSRREEITGIPYDEYADGEYGRIHLPRVFAMYDAGATLVLTHMHEMLPPLGRFCRGLEQIFLHAVQCNVYLTPHDAQGFRVHYDTHDVLILQVQGEKLWRYWPTPCVPFANSCIPWKNQPIPDEEPRSQLLRPGDVLFVPRGTLHDAKSQGAQDSLHLTIGILGQSWGDALRAALDVMEREDPALRQLFPMWRLAEGGISDDLLQEAAKRLSALSAVNVMELTSQYLLTKLATERMAMLSRGLIAPTISPSDRLYLSDTVHYFVVPRPDGSAELGWAGGNVTLSAQEFSWIARLGEGATAHDLGGSDALAFCQRLASYGIITAESILRTHATTVFL